MEQGNSIPKLNEKYVNEAIAELEERQKEDEYIHQKMKESLSMGSKAQSLAFIEAYRIIDNRVNANW